MTMKHELRVICRPGVAAGFDLASLAVMVAVDADAAAERLAEARRDPRVGLVLIEDDLQPEPAPAPASRSASKTTALPFVVPFPGPAWKAPAAAAEERVLEILRRALGYRVRLR